MESAKAGLRTRMKAVLNSISVADHAANSMRACQRIAATDAWQQARTVLFFAPLPFEIDLTTLAGRGAREGKRVCVPRVDWETRTMHPALAMDWRKDLLPDRHGLLNPRPDAPAVALAELDLVLVPGLAFEPSGARLGRGGGFYDRLLADATLEATTIGVCFGVQVLGEGEIPVGPLDRRVQSVVTE